MSSELLAALAGAAVGALITVIVAVGSRVLTVLAENVAGRHAFARKVSEYLQRVIKATTPEELTELSAESFGFAEMSLSIPQREMSVYVWFIYQQSALLDLAMKRMRKPSIKRKVRLFGDVSDAMNEIANWAKGDRTRSFLWFWWQLRTTYKADWALAQAIGRGTAKDLRAKRKTRAATQKVQFAADKQKRRALVQTRSSPTPRL